MVVELLHTGQLCFLFKHSSMQGLQKLWPWRVRQKEKEHTTAGHSTIADSFKAYRTTKFFTDATQLGCQLKIERVHTGIDKLISGSSTSMAGRVVGTSTQEKRSFH